MLDKIIHYKKAEVAEKKELFSTKLLEKSLYFESPVVSMKEYILRADKNGIIAEIKRKSPSKGWINPHISVEQISMGYMQSGVSALSVLTDNHFFGGSSDDLKIARKFNFCPILRKDFIIDEYQILEAKSIGADTILLIAAVLTKNEVDKLALFAHQLGLEVLLEVHSREEILQYASSEVDLIGINSRDLQNFEVRHEHSLELCSLLPKESIKIAESGIQSAEDIKRLRSAGFHGFLIGELFMKNNRPDKACLQFSKKLIA